MGTFSRWQIDYIFLIFPENRLWYFMQVVSPGDNLHELSKRILWENKKKYFEMSSAEAFTQHAKH